MKKPFRVHHLLQILDSFESSRLPFDAFLRDYFRTNKAIGSKDRAFISDTAYGLIRWRGLCDHFAKRPLSWENRYEIYQNLERYQATDVPAHIRVSFPKNYFSLITDAYGEKRAVEMCLESNKRAPTTIRANALRCTRDQLLAKWDFPLKKCMQSKVGLSFEKKINIFALPEFKEGLFEMQDEASQLVAAYIDAKPKEQILDFCAGSGGKTLAFAPDMKESGQIYLYDIRPQALIEAKKRLKRAGVENGQIVRNLPRLKGKMDCVLVDAPCSGSGTLRRNPDMKWRFSSEMLDQLVQKQREIVQEAISYLKPGGRLIYATCSIFPQENEEQVHYFTEHLGMCKIQDSFHSFPTDQGMDGFFAVKLKVCK